MQIDLLPDGTFPGGKPQSKSSAVNMKSEAYGVKRTAVQEKDLFHRHRRTIAHLVSLISDFFAHQPHRRRRRNHVVCILT